MKKQSANVVPQTAVDFLGTDQRQVIYQEILKVSCRLALFFLLEYVLVDQFYVMIRVNAA